MDGISLLVFSLVLFAVAWAAILLRRNLLVMSMGIQWLFVAVAVSFVGFARLHAAGGEEQAAVRGESAAIFVLVLASIHLATGLAVVFAQARTRESSNVDDASDLRW